MRSSKDATNRLIVLRTVLPLFAIAFFTRILFLLFVIPIDPYEDSFHHWQVSYYTLHVGLKYGRLWDLSGMEYFWGVLPTLVQSFLLVVLNTASLLPFRLFNVVIGSATVCLLFLVGKRYFNERVGLLLAVASICFQVILLLNATGLFETLGIFFLLSALLLYDRSEYLCGLCLALASMSHVLFWVVSWGICGAYLVLHRSVTRFIPSLAGWLSFMGPYFIFLWSRTGNPIYPFYWGFFGNIAGVWNVSPGTTRPLSDYVLGVVFVILIILPLLQVVRKKPRNHVVYILFLGYFLLQAIIFFFTAYTPARERPWILLFERTFVFEYLFVFLLASIGIDRLISRFRSARLQRMGNLASIFTLVLIGIISIHLITPINYDPRGVNGGFETADWIVEHYAGGTILCNMPTVTYQLINKGVPYSNILGTLYIEPHGDWDSSMRFLERYNVTWLVMTSETWEDSHRAFPFLLTEKGFAYHLPPFHLACIERFYIYSVDQKEVVAQLELNRLEQTLLGK